MQVKLSEVVESLTIGERREERGERREERGERLHALSLA